METITINLKIIADTRDVATDTGFSLHLEKLRYPSSLWERIEKCGNEPIA
jgi:hypothetical protein